MMCCFARLSIVVYAACIAVFGADLYAAAISKSNNFTPGTVISSSQINSNFDQLFVELNAKETRLTTLESGGGSLWSVNGTSLYYNAGNVGVGTATPQVKLEVNGSSGAALELVRFQNVGAFDASFLSFPRTSDLTRGLWIGHQIGPTDVGNHSFISARGGVSHSLFMSAGLNAVAARGDIVLQESGGLVGIGTTSPASIFHTVRNDNASDEMARFENQNTGASAQSYITLGTTTGSKGGYLGYDYTNSHLFLGLHGALSTLNIKSGNVGIGTVTPGVRLQVGDNADGTTALSNAWNIFSDERLKKNITPIDDVGKKIQNLRGYYYHWKQGKDSSRQIGVLAQNVKESFPELVTEDAKGFLSVDYSKLSAVLIEAMREQQIEISNLKSRDREMKVRLDQIEKLLKRSRAQK